MARCSYWCFALVVRCWALSLLVLGYHAQATAARGFYPGSTIVPEAVRYRSSRKVVRRLEGDFLHAVPSCVSESSCLEGYGFHQAQHAVPGELEMVFDRFVHQNPRELWGGATRLDLLYAPLQSGVFSRESSEFPPLEVGQVFVLKLRFLGVLRLPVAFKVIDINYEEKSLSFSYLTQNVSQGVQVIRFVALEHQVLITHTTHFRSDSPIRDRYFYARWHSRYLKGYYRRFFDAVTRETEGGPIAGLQRREVRSGLFCVRPVCD